jgi:hypothetical protein
VRVLFDQGTPVPLRGFLTDHEISTAYELGWPRIRRDIPAVDRAVNGSLPGGYAEVRFPAVE